MDITRGNRFVVMTEGEFSSFAVDWNDYADTYPTNNLQTFQLTASNTQSAWVESVDDDHLLKWTDNRLYGCGFVDQAFQGTPPIGSAGDYIFPVTFFYNGASAETFTMSVRVLPAPGTDDEETEFEFQNQYCLLTLVTDKGTWNLGGGISGGTLSALATSLNLFFSIADFPILASVVSGKLRLEFSDGSTLTGVTLCDSSEVNFTTVTVPTETEANNEFFGKDNPGDAEYSYYTIINTCTCGY